MKKILLTLSIALTYMFSYAQFTTSGNPTTTMDNVGIGTTPPSIGNYGVLALNGRSPSQGGYFSMMMNGAEVGAIAANTQFNFQTVSGVVTQFYTGSTPTYKFQVRAMLVLVQRMLIKNLI